MSPAPRQIVFQVPSLMPEDAACDRGEWSGHRASPPDESGGLATDQPDIPGDESSELIAHALQHPSPRAGQPFLVAEGDVIHGHPLSPTLQTAEASGTVVSRSLREAVAVFESNLIRDALKSARGNRSRAARLLDTTERILSYKVRRYGIDPRRFRG